MRDKGLKRSTVFGPPKLLEDFDEAIIDTNYEWSKAIRLIIQDILTEYRWTSEEKGPRVLIMTRDHEIRGVE